MASEEKGTSCGAVFMSFVMGAAIGGGLALLTAPRSGEETRDKISKLSDEVRDKIRTITEEAEARIKEVVEEGRETLDEKREKLKSAVDAGREAMETERAREQTGDTEKT